MPLEAFDLREVEQSITQTEFSGCLHHLASTSSTNDLALKAALSGAGTGVWIADEQTAGRGRGGHAWHSAPGDGLYLTALVSPPIPMQSALRLSLSVAIAVQSAIAATCGFRVPTEIDIRWPNDLILNGRKCGGILIETAAQPAPASGPAMLRHAIIGIGINCNHTSFPPELDSFATSLRRELPDPNAFIRRESLAAAILIALDEEIRLMIGGLHGTNNERYRNIADYSTWIANKRVRVEPRDDVPGYTGTTAGLNPAGFLLVNGDDGQLHTVLSGGLREL